MLATSTGLLSRGVGRNATKFGGVFLQDKFGGFKYGIGSFNMILIRSGGRRRPRGHDLVVVAVTLTPS